jgi:hypothetical protein
MYVVGSNLTIVNSAAHRTVPAVRSAGESSLRYADTLANMNAFYCYCFYARTGLQSAL